MSVRFEDSFWGDADEGFGVLLARIKQGKYTCKEILEVVATRAAIEEDYSKKLAKLAKVITSKVSWKRKKKRRRREGEEKGEEKGE